MNKKDAIFFKNFSLLIGFLIVLTALLALLGAFMNSAIIKEQKLDRSLIEKNLQPVAAVHTEANPPAQPAKTPQAGNTDPAALYQEACATCHGAGVAGAPTLDSAEWDNRVAKGKDVLVQHAIQGFNAMPPKGGRPDLSDEQVTQIVEYMMGRDAASKESTTGENHEATTTDTAAPVANGQNEEERIKHGQQIYQQACFACHGTGAAGAPKLEKSAWQVRLAKGTEALYNSSLHGIGVMPPKGGRMDLSDEDVKSAVDYMISQVQ